jgi:uncharacterized membrane protein affecting hemolysin expression
VATAELTIGRFLQGFQRSFHGAQAEQHLACSHHEHERNAMKILLWIIGIIFLIGLLVTTGVLKLIF